MSNKQTGSGRFRTEESTAVNRREQILEAAVAVFAEHGYYKATTAQIAEKVGISQPYIFKLFKNKEELFVAALERAFERMIRTFRAVAAPVEQLLSETTRSYEQLTETHPSEILLQVQALGIRDEAILQAMQSGMLAVADEIRSKFAAAGIEHPEVEVSTIMANGMLFSIAMALNMPDLKPRQA
ncbi:TetR/AcrR family transcriptional regulator ['Paenibacillus yunnanensis' Narsing Rao et al. 2020]|uniref:TetR/AcrR family transcriptional regulator n=1 Tax=Paenibacillus tengchongensis TaxID=2608684 RepID=UPI00124D5AEF|nr:TetR/AcrR family transcriptional regulator [Paenibacillus tengchongensis]